MNAIDYSKVDVHESAHIARNATVVGDVHIAEDCTVLFNATLRADGGGRVFIGRGSNIQENVCVHVPFDGDTVIGEFVTVGHGAILHGCTVGDHTLVGMGATLIDGARIGKNCIVGAGALVTGTTDIPDRMLVIGSPARAVRSLTEEEVAYAANAAQGYIEIGKNLSSQGYLVTGCGE